MKQLVRVLLVLCFGVSAMAEEDTNGSKISLEAGLGYSSNPYSLTAPQNPTGDMLARIAPQFLFTTHGRKLALIVDGSANMGALFGLNGNPGFLVFNGVANGSSTYNAGGTVSFFTRGSLNASRNLGELFVGNMTNLTGKAIVGSTIQPGGGKFALTLQGEYQVQGYPGITFLGQTTVPGLLNNQAYYLASRLSWQFLPKTALYAEGRYGFYENIDANNNHLTINPLWVGGGLTGRITPTVVANVSVYLSRIFIKSGTQSLKGTSFPMGAQAGFTWNFASHSSLSLNFRREMTPAPIFLDQVSNLFTLKYDQALFGRLVMTFAPQAGLLEYGKPDTTLSTVRYRIRDSYQNRLDFFAGLQATLVYSFNDWLAMGVSGEGFWRWTNTDPNLVLTQTGWVATGDGTDYQSLFTRYQANAFVRLTY